MDPEERNKLREKWKYEDKYPDDRGILLSDKIHELCQVGLLISKGYCERNLRPASYTLTIGDRYIDSDGKWRILSDNEDSFIFKRNSIVFVTTNEEFDIPFYVIARFNIRVTWVYDGVLLGTGPQVDPGFSGHLSCPLYNLTNLDIQIKRRERFATIDFEKTTRLLDTEQPDAMRETIETASDKENVKIGERTFSFYRRPPLDQLESCKAHRIVSSLIEMGTEVRTWRNLGIGSVIAFFGLTLSLLAFGVNIYRQNADLARELSDSRNELRDASARITNIEKTLDRLSGGAAPHHLPPEGSPTPRDMEKGGR